jgi:hypothetical protein
VNRRRIRIPGAGFWGSRRFWIRTDTASAADTRTNTLAMDEKIRGVPIPAGSVVWVDAESNDIHVTLHSSTTVRGVAVPIGSELTFPGSRTRLLPVSEETFHAAVDMPLPLAPLWLWRRGRDNVLFAKAVLSTAINLRGQPVAAGSSLIIHRDGTTWAGTAP